MLVEDKADPGGLEAIGLLQGRGGVELFQCALEEHRAVREGDADSSVVRKYMQLGVYSIEEI